MIRQIFGYGCVYGVVMKMRRKDRVVKQVDPELIGWIRSAYDAAG